MQASVVTEWYLLTAMSELWVMRIDPAFEGNRVTFTCLSGLILNRSNSSAYAYMGDGEWEPDSREVGCISEVHGTTGEYYIIPTNS